VPVPSYVTGVSKLYVHCYWNANTMIVYPNQYAVTVLENLRIVDGRLEWENLERLGYTVQNTSVHQKIIV